MMWIATPAKKPVVTGIDIRSATQPTRRSPTRSRMAPTMSAKVAASA